MQEHAEEIIRWVGAGIALIGAFVVSPDGTRLLFGRAVEAAVHAARQTKGWLARFIPFLRRDGAVHAGAARGTIRFGSNLSAGGYAPAGWPPTATTDERIAELKRAVNRALEMVSETRKEMRKSNKALTKKVDDLGTRLDGSLSEVSEALSDLQRRSHETDARALPVVGLGIVLTALPDLLAKSLFVWVPALLVALLITGLALRGAWRDRRDRSAD